MLLGKYSSISLKVSTKFPKFLLGIPPWLEFKKLLALGLSKHVHQDVSKNILKNPFFLFEFFNSAFRSKMIYLE